MASPNLSFTGPTETHEFCGILFDMDGTLIDSTDAIVKHWHKLGKELGVDPNVILATSHGRRSIDTLKMYDESKANWECQYRHDSDVFKLRDLVVKIHANMPEDISHVEGLIPKEYGADAVEIPGARSLLDSLSEANAPWAIVTSGTRPLMDGWLARMGLAYPKHNVVAEDVENGKPDPACYQLGLKRLGLVSSAELPALVIEDAPAGVRAGKAAGCKVLGLATTHKVEQIRDAGADWIVEDLRSLKFVKIEGGRVKLEISRILVR